MNSSPIVGRELAFRLLEASLSHEFCYRGVAQGIEDASAVLVDAFLHRRQIAVSNDHHDFPEVLAVRGGHCRSSRLEDPLDNRQVHRARFRVQYVAQILPAIIETAGMWRSLAPSQRSNPNGCLENRVSRRSLLVVDVRLADSVPPRSEKLRVRLTLQPWRLMRQKERAFLHELCLEDQAEIGELLPQGDGQGCDVEDCSWFLVAGGLDLIKKRISFDFPERL